MTAPVKGRIEFPNGWGINVQDVVGGQVYYQRWPPGVEDQGMFDNLVRMDSERFIALVEAE